LLLRRGAQTRTSVRFVGGRISNNRRHGDGFSVAASPPLQSRACCGRSRVKNRRVCLENRSHTHLKSIKKESAEEGRQLLRMLKLTPLIVFYGMYVSGIYKAEGLLSASVAWLWVVFLIVDWPKGIIKKTGLALVFGVFLPFVVLPYFGH